jgi:SAM-dependent methyltransferase
VDDIADYNRRAWDGLVARGDRWTVPVPPETIAAARSGQWEIVLTPSRPVPHAWFPDLVGRRTLCLAGAGGQQGPTLAAAGAVVTVFDNSPRQLAQDRTVADRDGLAITTVQGDMRNLGAFDAGAFELIVHPCSNCFVPDVRAVWRECARVLAPGGILLAGFFNPDVFIFDADAADLGELIVRHRLPYSDAASLNDDERARLVDEGEPFVFSHCLTEQIGGQLDAGLVVTGFYDDGWPDKLVSAYMPVFYATRAVRAVGG